MAPTVPPTPPVPPVPVVPSPPPVPVEAPPPTQTVIVNLPADIVDKLSPHESGLSTPWATIIAACITVLAAGVALFGIWWQIRAAAEQSRRSIRAAAAVSRKSIRAAAEEARNDRVADARLARQAQLTERMAEALGLARSLEDLLNEHNSVALDKWDTSAQQQFNEQTQRARTLCNILMLLEAGDSCAALHAYTLLANIKAKHSERGTGRAGPDSLDGKSFLELRSGLHTAFTTDLSVLGPSRR
ncbi:hypothetical protein [Mycolicibacterium houstonense]|uniref:hypothetical protein n=1 Tax=Mycolicibacterium houstonense TaxID=146021 RepID=UPI003F996693